MASTRSPRLFTLGIALSAAAVLSAGVVSLSAGPGTAAEPLPFWGLVGGVSFEVDPPDDVDAISQRADAIVLAHVTGVVDGRPDPGYEGVAPPGTRVPRSCLVQLTVDRVVKGSVTERQVLNLEMHTPPAPLGLTAARENLPKEQYLFFLNAGSASATGKITDLLSGTTWHTLGARSILGAGQYGLVLPLPPGDPALTFVQSFGATTVDGAADRAAQAVR